MRGSARRERTADVATIQAPRRRVYDARVPKVPTSFRISPEADRILTELAERLGLSKTAIMEAAIRLLSRLTEDDLVELASRLREPATRRPPA